MLRFILSIALLAVLALWSFNFVKRSQAKTAIGQICQTVATNFFDTTKNLEKWSKNCRAEAVASLAGCDSINSLCISSALNMSFSSLESSHLFVSTPTASRRFYHHETQANGLKLKWVHGKVIIAGTYKGSPAEKVAVQYGDLVISADGDPVRSLQQIQQAREIVVDRRGDSLTFHFETATFQMDFTPTLEPLSHKSALFTIASFEGKYEGRDLFDSQYIRELSRKLTGYQGVVIDLRGNLGGNFVALLRALSPFLCEESPVGTLQKLGKEPQVLGEFPDSLEFADQWPVILDSDGVLLKSFSGYGCYRGKVALLVDSETSSVAEIFAHVLRLQRGATILGHPTAGAVLVALRDELHSLGPDFYLNMPILTYLDPEGAPLEGVGIWPDHQLQYSLSSFRQGRDNWVQEALGYLNP